MVNYISQKIEQLKEMNRPLSETLEISTEVKEMLQNKDKELDSYNSQIKSFKAAICLVKGANDVKRKIEEGVDVTDKTVDDYFKENGIYDIKNEEGAPLFNEKIRAHFSAEKYTPENSAALLDSARQLSENIKDDTLLDAKAALDEAIESCEKGTLSEKRLDNIIKIYEPHTRYARDTTENIKGVFASISNAISECKNHIIETATDYFRLGSLRQIEKNKEVIYNQLKNTKANIEKIEGRMEKLTAHELSRRPILNAVHNIIHGDNRTLAEAGRVGEKNFEDQIRMLSIRKIDLEIKLNALSKELISLEKQSMTCIRDDFANKDVAEMGLSNARLSKNAVERVQNLAPGFIVDADTLTKSQMQAINMAEKVLPDAQLKTILNEDLSGDKMMAASSLYLNGYSIKDVNEHILCNNREFGNKEFNLLIDKQIESLDKKFQDLDGRSAVTEQLQKTIEKEPSNTVAQRYLDQINKEALSDLLDKLSPQGVKELTALLENADNLTARQTHMAIKSIAKDMHTHDEPDEPEK